MRAINFSLSVAQESNEALLDNSFFCEVMEQDGSNYYEFEAEYENEIVNQLNLFGIDSDEYEITNVN